MSFLKVGFRGWTIPPPTPPTSVGLIWHTSHTYTLLLAREVSESPLKVGREDLHHLHLFFFSSSSLFLLSCYYPSLHFSVFPHSPFSFLICFLPPWSEGVILSYQSISWISYLINLQPIHSCLQYSLVYTSVPVMSAMTNCHRAQETKVGCSMELEQVFQQDRTLPR